MAFIVVSEKRFLRRMHGLNGTDALKPERNCDIMSIIFHIIPEKLLTSVWIFLVFSCTAVYNEHIFYLYKSNLYDVSGTKKPSSELLKSTWSWYYWT